MCLSFYTLTLKLELVHHFKISGNSIFASKEHFVVLIDPSGEEWCNVADDSLVLAQDRKKSFEDQEARGQKYDCTFHCIDLKNVL